MITPLHAVQVRSLISLHSPALCPVQAQVEPVSSSVTSFPPSAPLSVFRLCSPTSLILLSHLTSHMRTWQACPLSGSLPVQAVALGADGIPRFSRFGFPRMHRFIDSAVPTAILLNSDRCDIAFPWSGQGRRTKVMISELNSWPTLPPARTLSTTSLPSSHLRRRPKSIASRSL